jgi:hypothetical protein
MLRVFDKLKVAYVRIVVKTTLRPVEKERDKDLSSYDVPATVLRSIQI